MSATEWAILRGGEIFNVVTTERGREAAERTARRMGIDVTVMPLDEVPLDVKERYRYWNERP